MSKFPATTSHPADVSPADWKQKLDNNNGRMNRTLFCFFLFACCCCCGCCCCCCFGLSLLFFALVLLVVALFCAFFGLKSSSSMLRTANRDGMAVAIFPSDNEDVRRRLTATLNRTLSTLSWRWSTKKIDETTAGSNTTRRLSSMSRRVIKPAKRPENGMLAEKNWRCTSTTYRRKRTATLAPRRGDQPRHGTRRHRVANCAAMKNISARFAPLQSIHMHARTFDLWSRINIDWQLLYRCFL